MILAVIRLTDKLAMFIFRVLLSVSVLILAASAEAEPIASAIPLECQKKLATIRPGMTRAEVNNVLSHAGGISSRCEGERFIVPNCVVGNKFVEVKLTFDCTEVRRRNEQRDGSEKVRKRPDGSSYWGAEPEVLMLPDERLLKISDPYLEDMIVD